MFNNLSNSDEVCCLGCQQPAKFSNKYRTKFYCESTANKCPAKRNRASIKNKFKNPWEKYPHPKGKLGKPAWNKGLSANTDERVAAYGKKIAVSLSGVNTHQNVSDAQKTAKAEKCRKNIEERYNKGWQPKAGRCKKITYCSPIAGEVKIDGTYELRAVKILDLLGVAWARNTQRFDYIDQFNKSRKYTPDFFVATWNKYIEVKGYETEQDRCKWRDFPYTLDIWKLLDIQQFEKNVGLAE